MGCFVAPLANCSCSISSSLSPKRSENHIIRQWTLFRYVLTQANFSLPPPGSPPTSPKTNSRINLTKKPARDRRKQLCMGKSILSCQQLPASKRKGIWYPHIASIRIIFDYQQTPTGL